MNKPSHDQSSSSEPIESLVEQVQRGNIGRRDFLRRAVTAGVSSAVAYSLLGQATAAAQNGTAQNGTAQNGTAQNVTTYAIGEESTTLPTPPTSTAIGEEGQPPALGRPTTAQVGEENTR